MGKFEIPRKMSGKSDFAIEKKIFYKLSFQYFFIWDCDLLVTIIER